MFHNFHSLQSDMVFGIINSFPWMFNAVFSGKSCATSILFLLTYIEFRTVVKSFSCLLNPDWSIQISGVAAVCKDVPILEQHNHYLLSCYFSSNPKRFRRAPAVDLLRLNTLRATKTVLRHAPHLVSSHLVPPRHQISTISPRLCVSYCHHLFGW